MDTGNWPIAVPGSGVLSWARDRNGTGNLLHTSAFPSLPADGVLRGLGTCNSGLLDSVECSSGGGAAAVAATALLFDVHLRRVPSVVGSRKICGGGVSRRAADVEPVWSAVVSVACDFDGCWRRSSDYRVWISYARDVSLARRLDSPRDGMRRRGLVCNGNRFSGLFAAVCTADVTIAGSMCRTAGVGRLLLVWIVGFGWIWSEGRRI